METERPSSWIRRYINVKPGLVIANDADFPCNRSAAVIKLGKFSSTACCVVVLLIAAQNEEDGEEKAKINRGECATGSSKFDILHVALCKNAAPLRVP